MNAAVLAVHKAFDLDKRGRAGRGLRRYGPVSARPGRAKPTLAVVGATGAVGTVMLDLLSTRDDVWGEIRLIASLAPRVGSCASAVADIEVLALAPRCSTGSTSRCSTCPTRSPRQWAPVAAARGAVAVDNSGAFRMDPDVPLVVPEVNPAAARRPAHGHHRQPQLHHAVDDRGDGRAAPRVRARGAGGEPPTRPPRAPASPASTRCAPSWPRSPDSRQLGQRAGDVRAVRSVTSGRSRPRWR